MCDYISWLRERGEESPYKGVAYVVFALERDDSDSSTRGLYSLVGLSSFVGLARITRTPRPSNNFAPFELKWLTTEYCRAPEHLRAGGVTKWITPTAMHGDYECATQIAHWLRTAIATNAIHAGAEEDAADALARANAIVREHEGMQRVQRAKERQESRLIRKQASDNSKQKTRSSTTTKRPADDASTPRAKRKCR
jgi:hypothetical protein